MTFFLSAKKRRVGVGFDVGATLAFCLGIFCFSGAVLGAERDPLNPAAPDRLPTRIDGRPVAPDLGCFWSLTFDDEKYKDYIDAVGPVGTFDSLVLTLRGLPTLDGNAQAVETTRKAVEYAREKFGVGTLLDVDLRIARSDFEKKYPERLQERLLFQEVDLRANDGDVQFELETSNLSDHYTGNYPYYVRGKRVVAIWTYRKNAAGEVVPESIVAFPKRSDETPDLLRRDDDASNDENPGRCVLSFQADDGAKFLRANGDFACVAVAFRYSYPDVFADETLELERRLYEQFRDVPAAGVAKDEWGFPPHFDRVDRLNDFWFSEQMNAAYRAKYSRFDDEQVAKAKDDLVGDLFLAFRPQAGRGAERVAVLDRYRRLYAERILEYEIQNYQTTKEFWGPDAFVGVHCTWYPWPNSLEMRKNGLMWWKAPRDFAQTDEYVPFCCRNSLAKATDSLWINMFYARQVPAYIKEHWTAAASGGRVHIHQIYPRDENSPTNPRDSKMLPIIEDGGVAKIRAKVRMLNLISNAPLDSPVAVVFGRYGVMNPLRPENGQVGVDLCDRLATRGFPADLIPSDEIESRNNDGSPRWKLNDDKYLQYGSQQYSEVVFFGENDVDSSDFTAIRELAGTNCATKISALSTAATLEERDNFANGVVGRLNAANVAPQTPWSFDGSRFDSDEEIAARPPVVSISRFVDGTILWVAAEKSDFGDPILLNDSTVELGAGRSTPPISATANGIFAVRFNENGALNAVAAADLKRLRVGEFDVELSDSEIGDDPIDVAIWKDSVDGVWRGVFQRCANDLPESLEKTSVQWRFLRRDVGK